MTDDSTAAATATATMQVRINARLPSVQRGDRYEDPLAYWLEHQFPGSHVTGGGTLLSSEGEPLSCGIDAQVVGDHDEILDGVTAFLVEHGTPHGSSATIVGDGSREFGSTEGLALYLNGTDLSPEVYADNDVNTFFDLLHAHVTGTGALHAFWEGPHTTAVYLYGASADAMRAAIAPLLETHPLAQSCRLEQIA
jgi:hypothetical protein